MILKVTKYYLIEQFRSFYTIIGSVMTPAILLIFAYFMKQMDLKEYAYFLVVKGQFVPLSILLLVFSLGFTSSTSFLTEKKEDGSYLILKKTNLKIGQYYIGTAIGLFIIFNIFLIAFLLMYSLLIDLSGQSLLAIILFSNLVLLCLYPVSHIVASFFSDSKKVISLMTPISLLLMFSVTMPSMFAMLQGKDAQAYYKYLFWNPMFILNDVVQNKLDIVNSTWLTMNVYFVYLAVIFIVGSYFSLKVFRVEKF